MVKNFIDSGPFYARTRVPQLEGRVPYPYVNTPELKDNGKTAGYKSIAKCDTASQYITVRYLSSLRNGIVASNLISQYYFPEIVKLTLTWGWVALV